MNNEGRSYWRIILAMILASLFLHLLVLGVWLMGLLNELFVFEPTPPPEPEPAKLVMQEEPLPELLAQQMPPQFLPTFKAQEVAEEDPNAPFEGEHNTRVQSLDPARDPNSMQGDMRGETDKGMTFNNTPMIQGKEQSQPTPPTPPTEKPPEEPTKEEPKPEEAKPNESKEKPPEKPDEGKEEETIKAEATEPSRDKETTPKREFQEEAYAVLDPVKQQQKKQAREKPSEAEAQPQKQPRPPPLSLSQRRTDVQGGGPRGDLPSSQVRSTPEGRYMAKVYRAISSRWHLTIPQHKSTMSPGVVEITFFLRANGVVENIRVTRQIGANDLFATICITSIADSAPFEVFPDAMKQQYGRGREIPVSFTLE